MSIVTTEDSYLRQDPVGELETNIEMPRHGSYGSRRVAYKLKANNYFTNMNKGDSFFVSSRTVEAVKKWAKDWRRELRATGKSTNEKLAERGFLCKDAEHNSQIGVRVWRFK